MTIWAQSYSQVPGNVATILCMAAAPTQTFTIPKRVLAALPVTGAPGWLGMISIGQYNTPTSFTAPGLTPGIITDIFNNAIWVNFN